MPITWPSGRGSFCLTGARPVLVAGLLGALLGQSLPRPAFAAVIADLSSGTADLLALTGVDPASSAGPAMGPVGEMGAENAGSTARQIAPGPSQGPAPMAAAAPAAAVGLQLLDPAAAAGDADEGFFADIERWTRIFLVEYQTFLPLIAMFVAVGAIALAYDVRRRLPMARGGLQTGVSRPQDRLPANRGATLARTAILRTPNGPPRPRGPDRSRIEPAPVPPSLGR